MIMTASRSIMLGLKLILQCSQNQSKPTFAVQALKFVAFRPTHPGWKTLPHSPLHRTLLSDRPRLLPQALHASMSQNICPTLSKIHTRFEFPYERVVEVLMKRRYRSTNTCLYQTSKQRSQILLLLFRCISTVR